VIDTQVIAKIHVPQTPLTEEAVEYARRNCEPYLFNHAMRSWLFAIRLAQLQQIEHDAEVVALGTLLHDITLNERFAGPRRFEIEAADLARGFARSAGVNEARAELVWDCVALNSTPSIALYKKPDVSLCTAGIALDIIGLNHEHVPIDELNHILAEFPRLEIKRKVTERFCAIARDHPETTYDNFLRDYGIRLVPGYKAPSVVDLVMNAPFDD
jgi:hypothetical protein